MLQSRLMRLQGLSRAFSTDVMNLQFRDDVEGRLAIGRFIARHGDDCSRFPDCFMA